MVTLKTLLSDGALPTVSADEMRALEQAAMAAGTADGPQLMERAGAAVVAAALARWGELEASKGKACILCGPGNNGGDGYVIARLLADRGWEVSVVTFRDTGTLPPDARLNHDRWAAAHDVLPWGAAGAALAGTDLVVDALFGIGLSRPLRPQFQQVFDQIPPSAHKVAVDVPSGILADSAQAATPDGAVFPADLVVTFHAPKPVHPPLVRDGLPVVVADIGI